MISKPQNGWVDITIGDWTDRASYLTDVQNDFLDCITKVMTTHLPNCFYCDAEGWEYIIVISENAISIIREKDTFDYYTYEFYENNVLLKDVAKTIVNDIESNLNEWRTWEPCLDLNDMGDIENYKNIMLEKLNKLKGILKDQ